MKSWDLYKCSIKPVEIQPPSLSPLKFNQLKTVQACSIQYCLIRTSSEDSLKGYKCHTRGTQTTDLQGTTFPLPATPLLPSKVSDSKPKADLLFCQASQFLLQQPKRSFPHHSSCQIKHEPTEKSSLFLDLHIGSVVGGIWESRNRGWGRPVSVCVGGGVRGLQSP